MKRSLTITCALAIACLCCVEADASQALVERVDVYSPTGSEYLGSETQWFAPDGRRLRWVNTDARGTPTLLFFVLHDEHGRESEAVYFEDGSTRPSRETFEYRDEGRTRRTRYFGEDGASHGYVDVTIDAQGRELAKRYFRDDGTQWAEEDIPRDEAGNMQGWHFRYLERGDGAVFEYRYLAFDEQKRWIRRVRSRDGQPERFEARTLTDNGESRPFRMPGLLGHGRISTSASETSPSFSADGQTMVFARYQDDWTRKQALIARRTADGWSVTPLPFGDLYNIAISPDARRVYFAVDRDGARVLFYAERAGDAWSEPVNLTEEFGVRGAYVAPQGNGDLIVFDANGTAGAGIYLVEKTDNDYAPARPLYTPEQAPGFDGFRLADGTLLVTRCFDDACASGPKNGIWRVDQADQTASGTGKLPGIPYGWGAQPVPALGVLVFTDGEDILTLPLNELGLPEPPNQQELSQ